MDTTTPRFSTVLAVRDSTGRPSDLEFLFRSHCRNLRIVQHLAGDAHLLLTKVHGSTSLAIRVYNNNGHDDTPCSHDSSSSIQTFFQTYQMAVIFVVASSSASTSAEHSSLSTSSIMSTMLNDPSSLFHRAQKLACQAIVRHAAEEDQKKEKLARTYLVSTAEVALSILFTLEADLLKEDQRHKYYQRQCVASFIPPYTSPATHRYQQQTASVHVAEALRRWGDRYELPPMEVNVLMSVLGCLANIASGDQLENVPVEKRTKKMVSAFFGIPDPPELCDDNFVTVPPEPRHEPQFSLEMAYPVPASDNDPSHMVVSPYAGYMPTYIPGRDPPIVAHSMPRQYHPYYQEQFEENSSFHPLSDVYYDPSYDPPLVQHSLPPSSSNNSHFTTSPRPPYYSNVSHPHEGYPNAILGGNRGSRRGA